MPSPGQGRSYSSVSLAAANRSSGMIGSGPAAAPEVVKKITAIAQSALTRPSRGQ
jgi:hypothetical protein